MRACAIALLLAPAAAFLAAPMASCRLSTFKMALNDDITRAEEAALAAVKKYGAKSPEAANAWDEYEEIAASDNTAAFRPGLDEGCDTEASQECSDFEAQMAELQAIIEKGEAVTTDALVAQNKKLIEENQRLRRSLSAYK